jgi:hypothetical protein
MKLYNLGKVNSVLFKVSYVSKDNVRLVAVKGGGEFFRYLMDNYRGCNGLGTYTRDNIMFLELERIDASTMEKYRTFNLDSLKALFKKWKESKLPQQMSLF